MPKRPKTKSNRPAFADGSYFHDIPMLEVDFAGNWQVIDECEGDYTDSSEPISSSRISESDEYPV